VYERRFLGTPVRGAFGDESHPPLSPPPPADPEPNSDRLITSRLCFDHPPPYSPAPPRLEHLGATPDILEMQSGVGSSRI